MFKLISALALALVFAFAARPAIADEHTEMQKYFKDFLVDGYVDQNNMRMLPIWSVPARVAVVDGDEKLTDIIGARVESFRKLSGIDIGPHEVGGSVNVVFTFADNLYQALSEDKYGAYRPAFVSDGQYDDAILSLKTDKNKICFIQVGGRRYFIEGGFIILKNNISSQDFHRCISLSLMGLVGFKENLNSKVSSVLSNKKIFNFIPTDTTVLKEISANENNKISFKEFLKKLEKDK